MYVHMFIECHMPTLQGVGEGVSPVDCSTEMSLSVFQPFKVQQSDSYI